MLTLYGREALGSPKGDGVRGWLDDASIHVRQIDGDIGLVEKSLARLQFGFSVSLDETARLAVTLVYEASAMLHR